MLLGVAVQARSRNAEHRLVNWQVLDLLSYATNLCDSL